MYKFVSVSGPFHRCWGGRSAVRKVLEVAQWTRSNSLFENTSPLISVPDSVIPFSPVRGSEDTRFRTPKWPVCRVQMEGPLLNTDPDPVKYLVGILSSERVPPVQQTPNRKPRLHGRQMTPTDRTFGRSWTPEHFRSRQIGPSFGG